MANFQAILGKDFKTRIFRYPGGHMSWQGLESTDHALAKEDVYKRQIHDSIITQF